jgi:hypothetical protein
MSYQDPNAWTHADLLRNRPLFVKNASLARLVKSQARIREAGGTTVWYANCADCIAAGGYTQTTGLFQAGYCPHSGANGPLGGQGQGPRAVKRACSPEVANGHGDSDLGRAVADLTKARKALAKAETAVKGAFTEALARGTKPAAIARVMSVSRQRVHQIMKELGGVK